MPTREPIYRDDVTERIGPVDVAPPGEQPTSPRSHRRRRRRRLVIIALLVPIVLIGLGMIGGGLYLNSVEGDVQRVDAFAAVPEADRPQKDAAAKDAINFLLLGSDSRDPQNTGGSRSDTIIVLHVNKDHSAAQLISIPRDTWVYVPKSADGKRGGVNAKINAAYAWGGVPLMVQTVEAYTSVRIDHVALIDFSGFKEIVDALGGVDINVEQAFKSTHSLNPDGIRHFAKGPQTMDGAAALDYARERYALKDGDFGRIRHQQQVIKAILNKAVSGGVVTNPSKLNAFLQATADTVSVDEKLNMLSLGMQLRGLRSENLDFFTSPSNGTGRIGNESVVLPNKEKAKELFTAVRKDDTAAIKQIANSK